MAPPRRLRHGRAAALLLLAAGCLTPIDTADKRCPCAPGFFCDLARDRCVDEACTPAVRADDFRAEWATSNAIHFRWTPVGDRSRFVRYELHVAQTVEALSTPEARAYGSAENPELSFFSLPRTGGTEDLVDATTAWGLAAQASFVAQLLVFDTGLCASRTPAVARSTKLDLPDEVVLFRDAAPPGFYLPSSFRDVPDDTGPGRHLEWVPDLDPICAPSPNRVCGDNLRRSGMSIDLSFISAGAFADSFLELKVANGGTAPAFYARTWLSFRGCSDVYRLEPFAIAVSADYRTLQVPLTALENGAGPLAFGNLTDGGPLCEFNVGGQFTRTAADGGSTRVRVDDVRIRY